MQKLVFRSILVLFVVAFLIIILNTIYSNNTEIYQDGVTITPMIDTITPTSVTLLIESEKSIYRAGWEYRYRIEKKSFNGWKEAPIVEEQNIIMGISYVLDEENKLEHPIRWESKYGKLKSGTYRVVLYFSATVGEETEFYSKPFKII